MAGYLDQFRLRQLLNRDAFPPEVSVPALNREAMPIPQPSQSQTGTDQLRGLLQNPPIREEPSTKRKIAAALAGGLTGFANGPQAGVEIGKTISEGPYQRELQDWQSKVQPLAALSDIEMQDRALSSQEAADLASYVRALGETDPEVQASIAGARAGATAAAEEPYNVSAHQRDTEEQMRREEVQAGVRGETQGFEADQAELDRLARAREGSMDRASREMIAERERDLRGELATLEREVGSRIPVEQYQRAIDEATNEVLQGASFTSRTGNEVTIDERALKEIAVIQTGEDGRAIYILKPLGTVDKEFQAAWHSFKDEIDSRARELLGMSFPIISDSTNDWEEIPLDQFRVTIPGR